VGSGLTQTSKSDSDKPVAQVKLEDLSFICGHNRGETGGTIIDEHWSEVGGDTMIGMFRQIKNGKAQMYEFLTIQQTATGPVLRLKHFDPGLVGWEEKAQAYSYPLVSWKPNEVTLERAKRKKEIFQYVHTPE
jgi:hypothetical protein